MRAFIANAAAATAASGIPVTAITEMAVAQLEQALGGPGFLTAPHLTTPLAPVDATNAVSAVATEFGISLASANAAPYFNASGVAQDSNTVILEGIALQANAQAGANLAAKLNTMAQILAVNAASTVPQSITAILPTLSTSMNTTIASAVIATPTLPPVTAPTPAVAPPPPIIPNNTTTQITQANKLLTSLRTKAIQMSNVSKTGFLNTQASGVNADITAVKGDFSGVRNFSVSLITSISMLNRGAVPGTAYYTFNGPCSVVSATVAVCQNNHYDSTGAWITQQTTVTANAATAATSWAWQDDIVASGLAGTFPPMPAPSTALPGYTTQTGTATLALTGTTDVNGNLTAGSSASATFNGNFQPASLPTTTLNHKSVALTLAMSAVASGANTVDTGTITGTVSAVDSLGAVPSSMILGSGTNFVQTRVTGVAGPAQPVSEYGVGTFKTPNYQFDGTVDVPTIAKDLSPVIMGNWYPPKATFVGSITGIGTNVALGKFMNGTLSLTEDWSAFNPTVIQSSTNYQKNIVSFTGSITNSTVTPAMTYQVTFTDNVNTVAYLRSDGTLVYTDPSNNTVNVTASNVSGVKTFTATLGGITVISNGVSGSVYAGTPANVTAKTALLIGTITNSIVNFVDGSFISMQ